MESIYLANRLKEIFLNGTWVANTNFKAQLKDLEWETATTKCNGLNAIADLAQHIHYYISGVKQVFEGGNLEINDKYSFDFAPIKSQIEWDNFLIKFLKDAEELVLLIEQTPVEKLEAVFVEEKYSTYKRNIDGMIEHSYYHLGQIVLIKRILLNEK